MQCVVPSNIFAWVDFLMVHCSNAEQMEAKGLWMQGGIVADHYAVAI